jgi:hypothetical protein
MKIYLTAFVFTCFVFHLHAQNVGINTTNPNRPLTIRGTGTNNELLSLNSALDHTYWHLNLLSGGLNFVQTDLNTSRLFIDNFGRLGLGTTQPKNRIDVNGSMAVGASYAGISFANQNGMIIEGNVGIGTSNPLNKLDVAGGMIIGGNYAGNFTAPANGLIVQGMIAVGIDNSQVSIRVNGAIATVGVSFLLTGGIATINPGNRSYISLSNPSGIPTSIIMENGLTDGQILIIKTSVSAGGSILFLDSADNRTQLSGNFLMGTDDTLTLIWDSNTLRWIELHRSVN